MEAHHIMSVEQIGKVLKETRLKMKLQIKDVAEKSGVTSQTIINVEGNKNKVNLGTLLSIASVLNIKLVLSFEDRENPTGVILS